MSFTSLFVYCVIAFNVDGLAEDSFPQVSPFDVPAGCSHGDKEHGEPGLSCSAQQCNYVDQIHDTPKITP